MIRFLGTNEADWMDGTKFNRRLNGTAGFPVDLFIAGFTALALFSSKFGVRL